jgi:RecB family exonuclease
VLDHVSNSEVQVWKRCKRRWWLSYVQQLEPRDAKFRLPLVVGQLTHAGLDSYYMSEEFRTAESALAGVARERDSLMEVYTAEADSEALSKAYLQAHVLVENYVAWVEASGADLDITVIESERWLTARLTASTELLGRIDVSVKYNQELTFMEHKTSGNVNELISTLSQQEQVLSYMLLSQAHTSRWARTVRWRNAQAIVNVLDKRAGREPTRVMVYHSAEELSSFCTRLCATAREIERTKRKLERAPTSHHVVAPPNPQADCRWSCEFAQVCPLLNDTRDHGFAALEDLYVKKQRRNI